MCKTEDLWSFILELQNLIPKTQASLARKWLTAILPSVHLVSREKIYVYITVETVLTQQAAYPCDKYYLLHNKNMSTHVKLCKKIEMFRNATWVSDILV